MLEFVDFKLIKQQVSMQAVLGHYNVRLRRVNQHSLRGFCPLPTHSSKESKESFGVDTTKNIWACQSTSCVAARAGKKGGNVLDFVSVMESCSIRDAALKLHNWFSTPSGTGSANKIPRADPTGEKEKLVAEKKEGSDEQAVNKPLSFALKDIDVKHPYLRSRGISEETARHFGVGFFPGKGSMSGRVVIPIQNENGELVAYAGRAIDDMEPKYKLPAGFMKSAEMYNIHRAQLGDKKDAVVVVEGFFDCMKVWQSGFACVALMGSSLSQQQEKLLVRNFPAVVLMFDGDEAGRTATRDCINRLVDQVFVKSIALQDGKQPDQFSSDELQSMFAVMEKERNESQ